MVMIGRNAQPERINLATFFILSFLVFILNKHKPLNEKPPKLDILRLEGYFLLIFWSKKE